MHPQQLSKEEYMNMRMFSHESFIEGIKPACYVYTGRLSPEECQQLKSYPNLPIRPPLGDRGTIYFQTEEGKERFHQQIRRVSLDSHEAKAILGTTLGFPPKAVEFFTNRRLDLRSYQHRDTYKIGFNYAGIQFAGHIDDLEENVKWLWDTYENELPIWVSIKLLEKKSYHPEQFWIRYHNEADIAEAREFLQHILEQNREYQKNRT